MSIVRLARKPIPVPLNFVVERRGNALVVKNGALERKLSLHKSIVIDLQSTGCLFSSSDIDNNAAILGTTVAHFKNIITDMTKAYSLTVALVGIGFKAFIAKGRYIVMNVGFSHLVAVEIPKEVTVSIKEPTKVEISGFVEEVSLFADDLMAVCPWDACKRKGVVLAQMVGFLRKKGKIK